MITNQLVHEHNEALIDASHQSALLSLESCRRLSHYSLASLRDILNQNATANGHQRWWHSGLPVIEFGSRSLHEYGYFLEVSGETYARWTDLCEEQWQRAQDRVHTAINANLAPSKTGLTVEPAPPGMGASADEKIASTPSHSEGAKKKDAPTRSRKTQPRNA